MPLSFAIPVKKVTPRVIRQEEPELGIFSAAWLLNHFTPATKDDDYSGLDLSGLALFAGTGFTVSLLMAGLSFGVDSPHDEHAKVGILTGSAIAALIGGSLLVVRNAHYKKLCLRVWRSISLRPRNALPGRCRPAEGRVSADGTETCPDGGSFHFRTRHVACRGSLFTSEMRTASSVPSLAEWDPSQPRTILSRGVPGPLRRSLPCGLAVHPFAPKGRP